MHPCLILYSHTQTGDALLRKWTLLLTILSIKESKPNSTLKYISSEELGNDKSSYSSLARIQAISSPS